MITTPIVSGEAGQAPRDLRDDDTGPETRSWDLRIARAVHCGLAVHTTVQKLA
jgi:hypothetical protein